MITWLETHGMTAALARLTMGTLQQLQARAVDEEAAAGVCSLALVEGAAMGMLALTVFDVSSCGFSSEKKRGNTRSYGKQTVRNDHVANDSLGVTFVSGERLVREFALGHFSLIHCPLSAAPPRGFPLPLSVSLCLSPSLSVRSKSHLPSSDAIMAAEGIGTSAIGAMSRPIRLSLRFAEQERLLKECTREARNKDREGKSKLQPDEAKRQALVQHRGK